MTTAGNDAIRIEDRYPLFDEEGRLADDARELWALVEDEAEEVARAFAVTYIRSYSSERPLGPDHEARLVERVAPYLAIRFSDLRDQ